MPDVVLTLNAGSSSLKFGLFQPGTGADPLPLARGQIESLDTAPRLTARDASGATLIDRQWPPGPSAREETARALLAWIDGWSGVGTLAAAGHRIVHGGGRFVDPVRLDDEALQALDALTPLAPLHQPACLAPIQILRAARPALPQIGCFDTAFHHGLKPPVSRFALPRAYEERGLRRYGFHGLSHEFIARRLREVSPDLPGKRTVVAHLGNGASLCAMRDGQSVDTTMGFSTLDGLVMGTRCGAIDPGVLLWLQRSEGLTVQAVEHLLYHQSGLLGVSGLSADMRTLLASDDPRAAEAIALFTFSVARETAAMASTLGGLDCFVFTGGIGEHAPEIRARICDQLAWLGVMPDHGANDKGEIRISAPESRVEVLVMATNEEMMIAHHVALVMAET